MLLVLDDLHWADPATIDLLHYLARGVADEAVLVLGIRQEEVDTARGLRSLLTSLHRVGLGEEMVLARLDPSPSPNWQWAAGQRSPRRIALLAQCLCRRYSAFCRSAYTRLMEAGHLDM